MKSDNTVHIPVQALMKLNEETGRYEIDRERSVYVDIPADVVARFIMDGLHVRFEEEHD